MTFLLLAVIAAVEFTEPNGGPWTAPDGKEFLTAHPERVMPVGAGDLSAMVSFGADTLHVHFSKTDWFTGDSRWPEITSPGHVAVVFEGLTTNAMTSFSQRMDMEHGSVELRIVTAEGEISATIAGDHATGAMFADVKDARTKRGAVRVDITKGKPCARYDFTSGTVGDAGSGAFTVVVAADKATYGRARGLSSAERERRRLAWWRSYWDRGWVSLAGDERAELLDRLWHVNLYVWASVGYGPIPPKFNGGAGLVNGDTRHWGRNVWYQNTREMIWPMCAANRPEFADAILDMYDTALGVRAEKTAKEYPEFAGLPGVVLRETMEILDSGRVSGKPTPRPDVTAPYVEPTAEQRAASREKRLRRKVAHISHTYSSGTELLQQMIEYVRFTGDRTKIARIAAWLRVQTELYLTILEKGGDGKWHTHGTNVNESWWIADDSICDLAAARYLFSQTVAHGAEFGFPASLIAAAKDRLADLAPYPALDDVTWTKGRPFMKVESFVPGDRFYAPCAFTNGQEKSNYENNELYLVHPFGMANCFVPGPDRDRALETFRRGPNTGGGSGWTPVGIAAAWMRHEDAANVVAGHARNTCRWPYGGGRSPSTPLYKGAGVEEAPYLDGTGVMQTGVQELLLQSQADEPDPSFLTGGVIRLIPCVPKTWSGSFKLRARGGFVVTCAFEKGVVTACEILSERGNELVYADPKTDEVRRRKTKPGERVSVAGRQSREALTFPFESTAIVTAKGDPVAEFAAKELNAIVKTVTGREFGVEDERMIGCKDERMNRIHIGVKPEGWADGLKCEELVVTARGRDLYLFGERFGTLWAVYEFCEKELGYSWPFRRMDGEVFEPRDTVSYSGTTYRSAPAFPGYRCPGGFWNYSRKDPLRRWWVRNRDNREASDLLPDVEFKDRQRIPGHGFLFYLPPEDPDPTHGFRPPEIRGRFKEHPEWFSLGQDGRRHPDMQLCLSNAGCRKALLDAVLAWVRSPRGGKGIYMVGSNDNHNTRYCWCEGCVALEKKYDSVGGPLWDWLLEACAYLKSKPEHEGVRLTSLAYKGPEQTERAPKGVGKFPDNFVCDAAFLNSDRTLHEVFPVTLPDGTVFRRYENLLRWRELCDHVSYWYYGGANPAQVYDRMTREVRELHAAGVESVFGCGTGGGPEFGDMTQYLFQRLLWDPAFDAEAATRKLVRIKYGPAAEKVMEYIDALGGLQREAVRKLPTTTSCDPIYDGFGFLEGRDLVRLRRIMDAALARAKGTPYERQVLQSRIGLNIWTMTYFHKMRTADPAFAKTVDCAALDRESRTIVEAPGFLKGSQRAYVLNNLNEMANYASLRDDSLPPELAHYPADKVFRILPPKRAPFICGNIVPGKYTSDPDPRAVSGWAWSDVIPGDRDISKGIGVDVYDGTHRKWLMKPTENPIPLSVFRKDGYALFKLGTFPIPSRLSFVFAGMWASPTSFNQMQRLFDPTYENRQWETWLSVRGEGPKFFADATPGDSRLFIDQVFCVDKGVPAGK